MTYVRLASVATNLWDEQVDANRCIFILQVLPNLVNLALHVLRCEPETANDADATCASLHEPKYRLKHGHKQVLTSVGDCRGQFRTSSDVHACVGVSVSPITPQKMHP